MTKAKTPPTEELPGMPPRQVLLQVRYAVNARAFLVDEDDVPALGASLRIEPETPTGHVSKVTKTLKDGMTVYAVLVTEDDPE